MAGMAAVPVTVGAAWLWYNQEPDVQPSTGHGVDGEVSRALVSSKYELKTKLGKGGFGDVYLAIDNASGEQVAIKVLSLGAQPREMIEMEAYAMRRIGRHPNIVGLRDVVWVQPDSENSKGEVWLVMDLAAGGGLFERLVEEGAYSERQAASVVQQVALAIYHLHSRGIVHRDIKPENVVFGGKDADAPVRLIDFGTAVVIEEEGAMIKGGGRIGTWSYWAPEQLAQAPYDFAVDMWSLGVLMYILLVGYHPFDPEGVASEQEILANMRANRIEFDSPEWGGVSEQAKSLVQQMLCPDPAKRLKADQVVTHSWVLGEGVPASPLPATHERLSAFIKARHAFYGSLLMGLLAHHLSSSTSAEGVGAATEASFDAFEVGWRALDVDGKGHIDANDLRRVCLDMGYKVTEKDVENMLMVLSPTVEKAQEQLSTQATPPTISFERYKATMQASFIRQYDKGEYVFKAGDPVEEFFVITRGTCEVRTVGNEGGRVIATLGPGDFFGETGLLEGRRKRAASVICLTPVEVMAMDRAVFNQVAGGGDESKLSKSMRHKALMRQQARLLKVLNTAAIVQQQRRKYPKGEIIFQQGEPAEHFYILESGQLEMSVTAPDGRSLRVKSLKPGDHFGYDALLSEFHDTTVTCLTNAEVTAVPRNELRLASKNDEYLEQTAKAQAELGINAVKEASHYSHEAQILPMMARAAAEGGIEYDKYEDMLSKMQTVQFKEGETVFCQGDQATSVYLVVAGKLDCEVGWTPSSKSNGDKSTSASPSNGDERRVVATLGPGDHFGETALLEDRKVRNATVRCVAPLCELKAMANERFTECLAESPQLAEAVRQAAKMRTTQRVRRAIEAAADSGVATIVNVAPGEVIFRQGDRSSAFYMIESGHVEMSLTPTREDDDDDDEPTPVPIRKYGPGECFGASGLMAGDNTRRNTATAITPVTLKVIPHKHFTVMLRDNNFLKAGLLSTNALMEKLEKNAKIFDELDDEVVQRALRK